MLKSLFCIQISVEYGFKRCCDKWKHNGNIVHCVVQNFIYRYVHAHHSPNLRWNLLKFVILEIFGKNFCTENLVAG